MPTRFDVLSKDKKKLAIELTVWADYMGYNVGYFLNWLDGQWDERDEDISQAIEEEWEEETNQ